MKPPASEWPAFLRSAAEQYGIGRAYWVGLDTLGYPPTWAATYTEAAGLLARLNQSHQEG